MKNLGAELDEGNAAVIMLIRKVSVDKVLPKIKVEGKIIQTSLDDDSEQPAGRGARRRRRGKLGTPATRARPHDRGRAESS